MTEGERREAIADQEEDRRRILSLRSYISAYPDPGGRYGREIVQLEASIAGRIRDHDIP